MPRWNPPNALLYLGSIIRPALLKPDLKVPTIGHVDWTALRKEGFDAVVIDKDNCLTLPEQDELYPPLQTAWSTLLAAFPPGRVLLVSNSAGTLSKDPSGVAAEAVSLSLRAPVLLHARPKPGCAADIISYLSPPSPASLPSPTSSASPSTSTTSTSGLPGPSTLRARIAQRHTEALQEEREATEALVQRFDALASGPVWRDGERNGVVEMGKGREVYAQSFAKAGGIVPSGGAEVATPSATVESSAIDREISPVAPNTAPDAPKPLKVLPQTYGPRIAVVGDRLFTDTLLANRLRLLLPSHRSQDSVISIQTTSLPQPNDVRLLRRLESFLTRDRLRSSSTDWGRFALAERTEAVQNASDGSWRRYVPFRQAYLAAPELRWDPRSWRPITLLVASARGFRWFAGLMVVWARKGGRWAWESGKRWYTQGKVGQEEIKNISKEGLP